MQFNSTIKTASNQTVEHDCLGRSFLSRIKRLFSPQAAAQLSVVRTSSILMGPKIYILLSVVLLASCISQQHHIANPRYTPEAARNYVLWWGQNVRPDKRVVFEQALAGSHEALRSILGDTHNSYGPANQEGEPSSVLTGAFILAIGDNAFSEFLRGESPILQRVVFGSIGYGPWSFSDAEFSRMFPRTAKLRRHPYATSNGAPNHRSQATALTLLQKSTLDSAAPAA
jgi:hypothetical protein